RRCGSRSSRSASPCPVARATGRAGRGQCGPGTPWPAGRRTYGGSGPAGPWRRRRSRFRACSWSWLYSVVSGWGGGGVVGHGREDVVEAAVALLDLAPVALDPCGHEVEDLRFEVNGAALGVAAPAHHAGVLQHLEMLGDGLQGDVVRRGEVVDGGVPGGQARHDVAPDRVAQSQKGPRERVSC